MSRYIVTLDLGTSGPKVGLFTDKGQYIAHEIEFTTLNLLPNGGAEQDPDEWITRIKTALKRLMEKTKIDKEDIWAVSCTTQWSGTVPVDEKGKHIDPCIIWMDSRGADYVKKVMGGGIEVQGYNVFKALKWIKYTAGAPAQSGKDPIAHILYLKNEKPDIYKKAYKFLEPVDYLQARLTGKICATYDSITLHWVTDNRDIQNVKYHDGLIKAFGIEKSKLPDLVPTNSILGNISADAAEELGLSTKTIVVAGCADLHSAAVGSGAVEDYKPHFYIGTSSWLVCHLPFKKTDMDHNMATLPSGLPGRYILVNEQECAGACIQFLRDKVLFRKDEFSPNGPPENFYEVMNNMAAEVPAGSDGLIFIPHLYGERSPVEDHHARGAFFNLSLNHDRRHMIRAVMEGVALNGRWLLQYVEKNSKRKAEAVNLIGGGANSELWCQIIADVFNRPVRQMENPVMANSQGAAYLAAIGLKNLTVEEVAANAKYRKEFTPNPANAALYDKAFAEFTGYYSRNKKAHHRLNNN